MKFKDRVKIATQNIVHGAKSIYSGIQTMTVGASTYRPTADFWLFNQEGGADIHFSYLNRESAANAYKSCPPLTAVINRKAQAFVNGKTWIVNNTGKEKGKEAAGPLADKLRKLMQKPNPIQSWKQFEAQNYIYQQIFGFCIVLPIKPVGFSNQEATALWNIPGWMVEITEKPNVNYGTAKSWKDFIDKIDIVCNGYATPLNLDDVFIFCDFTPSLNSFSIPESRIRALSQNISNIIGALESRGVLIDKRGPSYVISSAQSDSSGNIPLTEPEKKSVEEDFRKYGLRKKQVQAIITSANIKVETIGFSTQQLMLFEEVEDSTMQICDGYNYPYRLLSSSKSNSLGGSDIKAFKSLLYQDAIIPEAESQYQQWNDFFGLKADSPIQIQKDYSHIPALQEDQVNEATARFQRNRALLIEFQNNAMTLNQWREANNQDPVTGQHGDKYYFELISMGIVFGGNSSGGSELNPHSDPKKELKEAIES